MFAECVSELAGWFHSVGLDVQKRFPMPVSVIARAGGGFPPSDTHSED